VVPLRRLIILFLLLSVVPLVLLAYSSIRLAGDAVSGEVEARVSATASNSAKLVQEELTALGALVESYAARPTLIAALQDRDPSVRQRSDLVFHLRSLRAREPGIYTTFLADPSGKLIDIVPATPAIVGKDYSFRDWYRGVTSTSRTYVSEAYKTDATGNPLVVAVATLVRGPGDGGSGREVLGILVAAYSLDHIQSISTSLASAQGVTLKVTDQRGTLLATPGATPDTLVSRSGDPRVAAALMGRSGVTELDTPDGRRLSAYAPISDLGWTVTVSVPADTAFAAVSKLRGTVVAIATGLGVALLLGFVFLFRTLRARQRAEAEAHRLAEINRAVLDATKDAIILLGPDGKIAVANAATGRIAEVFGVRPEGSFTELAAAVQSRVTDPDAYSASADLIVSDPEYEGVFEYEDAASGRSFQRYTAPVRDTGGELMGRIMTIREITAEREAERLKSELVATVSHELRTPLASILGFAELLVARDLDVDTRDRYLNTIYAEATRLTALVNDFLDLQRIEEGHFAVALEPFDLRDLLAQQVEVFSGQSSAHTVVLEAAAEPLAVLGERDRIAQVAGNLISNAIKYSPAGGRVAVSVAQSNGAVRVSVTDEGLGIPADEQRHIFQKFFRVDSADRRAIGGTGLGLALARDIVAAHGGRIGFESAEAKGSTFWFELPVAERKSSGRDGRVLVIEDDPAAASLLSEYLAADGYAVQVAATGEDGLARALADPPILVCLDIALPGKLDGWDVLARLKENPTTASVPVIVCTGRNGRHRAGALGAADFITKPFSRARLREAIRRILPEGQGSVLIVDDEDNVRRLVRETLRGDGFEFIEACDGEEALAAVAAHSPDAIVLDLVMPGLDGLAVLERLQADSATRSIPVIVLTAKRLSGAERQMLQQRAVALLEKSSYSVTELRRLVAQAVGLS
jgi:signal transduction histidine kinase/DNA-binding response OmpR family regulator